MAFAPNAVFLFIARAVDGLTAGNIPVAFAVISDLTKPEERAKAFGLIGSALSFGFVFGPAVAAYHWLWVRLAIYHCRNYYFNCSTTNCLFLPETNKHMGEVKQAKLFDFPRMWHTLFDPDMGRILLFH